jgi:hypothetical protein
MADDKKTKEKTVSGSIDLAKKLNDITFNNKQVRMISEMQAENNRVKAMMGRKKSAQASTPKISGLRTLEGRLGNQFVKQKTEYL